MLKDHDYSSKERRIIIWLNGQKKGHRFTASEISKPLDLSPSYIGNILKSIPGVKDSGEKAAPGYKVLWEVC
jgi:DNA-binding MarR family transcriptional regulator